VPKLLNICRTKTHGGGGGVITIYMHNNVVNINKAINNSDLQIIAINNSDLQIIAITR
jgi:ribosome recycling factor